MAQYVKTEYIAAYIAPLVPYCMEHLPIAHVACIAGAVTAQDADRCLLEPQTAADLQAKMRELVTTATKVVDAPATAAECRSAAVELIKSAPADDPALQGAKLPGVDQVAELCVHDGWSIEYVRCTAAGQKGCFAQPRIEADLKKLLGGAQH
jgi:hypothetical protein